MYFTTDFYIGGSLDRYGEYSEAEAYLFRNLIRAGQTVIDVGANIGTHTVVMAKAVGPEGRVFAFEPQRLVFQMLCGNVAMNAPGNAYAYQAAVGREMGSIIVPDVDYGRLDNFGGLSLGTTDEGERVPLITIDSIGLDACHFIKIDVEGMDSDVLAGAERTIRRHRPILYVENDPKRDSAALIERVFSLDYRAYWHMPWLFNPDNYFGDANNMFVHESAIIVSINMLCFHASDDRPVLLREVNGPADDWRG